MRKIAVIAGTPVDTKMGVDFIEQKNEEKESRVCEPMYLPAAEDCDAQMAFQYGSTEEKRRRLDEIFEAAINDGASDFFIYCNSLSGAFDFESYAAEKSQDAEMEINVYTPLQIYAGLGRSYSCIAVLAAHNMSAYAIEEVLMSVNPDISVIGSGNMQLVRMIEEHADPAEIADSCGLRGLMEYFEASGAEALILGCTHFPYLKAELEKMTSLPIIDPAEEMYAKIFDS